MKRIIVSLVVLSLIGIWCLTAQGRYIRPDLVNVPVAKLVENLEKIIGKNPKNVEARFNLARVHAMAYALKTDSAQAWRGKEDKGAWFGYEPRPVPFTSQPAKNAEQKKEAEKQLNKAIERYREVVKMDKKNLPATLGLGWCLDQQGKKKQAVELYRKVIGEAWIKEMDLKRAPLGWHSLTVEAAGYLIPHLDADKNQDEIADLKVRIQKMKEVPRPITPIAIPLGDNLRPENIVDTKARVRFDADGSGLPQNWTWIRPESAWLVYDKNNERKITSALQMFGSVTFWLFWDNGYHALSALDDNQDGKLSGKELSGLALWHDRNGNGVSEPGEVRPVADYGIASISCHYETSRNVSRFAAWSPRGVEFSDGSCRPTYDVILEKR